MIYRPFFLLLLFLSVLFFTRQHLELCSQYPTTVMIGTAAVTPEPIRKITFQNKDDPAAFLKRLDDEIYI